MTVQEKSRPITAFMTPRSLYQFTIMPFGIKFSSEFTFIHLINESFSQMWWWLLSDVLGQHLEYNQIFESHFVHMDKLLEQLEIHGLKCQLKNVILHHQMYSILTITDSRRTRKTTWEELTRNHGATTDKMSGTSVLRRMGGIVALYHSLKERQYF